jgi:hypothetical protein
MDFSVRPLPTGWRISSETKLRSEYKTESYEYRCSEGWIHLDMVQRPDEQFHMLFMLPNSTITEAVFQTAVEIQTEARYQMETISDRHDPIEYLQSVSINGERE